MSNSETIEVPVITVDGPGGSGKRTLSVLLAKALNFHLLDSGLIYRALAYAAAQEGIALDAELEIKKLANILDLHFHTQQADKELSVFLAGQDITEVLRTEKCGAWASKVSALPMVRAALLQRQRDFVKFPGLVADGRDMGTVVFPQAKVKFYVDASAEIRAKRRYEELKKQQLNVSLSNVLEVISERDLRDKNRVVAPLKPAEDAIFLETSSLSVSEVFQEAMKEVTARLEDYFV